jgi:hypothetical protein
MVDGRTALYGDLACIRSGEEWAREGKPWKKNEEFIRDEIQEKESVEKEWKANRFDANIRAMNERMKAAKVNVQETSDDP